MAFGGGEDKDRIYKDNSHLEGVRFVPYEKEPYPQYLDTPIRIEKNGHFAGIGYYRGLDKKTSNLVLQPCGVGITTHLIRREHEREISLSFSKKEDRPASINPGGADITPINEEDFDYFYR